MRLGYARRAAPSSGTGVRIRCAAPRPRRPNATRGAPAPRRWAERWRGGRACANSSARRAYGGRFSPRSCLGGRDHLQQTTAVRHQQRRSLRARARRAAQRACWRPRRMGGFGLLSGAVRRRRR